MKTDPAPRRVARGEAERGSTSAAPLPTDSTNPYGGSSDEEVEESPDRVLRSTAVRQAEAAAAAALPLSDDDDGPADDVDDLPQPVVARADPSPPVVLETSLYSSVTE